MFFLFQVITTEALNHTHNVNRTSSPPLLGSPQTKGFWNSHILASCISVSTLSLPVRFTGDPELDQQAAQQIIQKGYGNFTCKLNFWKQFL